MKIFLIVISIIIILALILVGYFWYMMGKALYKPGMIQRGENLKSSLEPPEQSNDTSFWNVEKDIKLYHFSDGNGKNVLIVHGGPGKPIRIPLAGFKPLTREYKFNYYDQRGCGKSTRPFDKFSSSNYYDNMNSLEKTLGIGAQIADIERIRKILNEDKLVLIGHSFGAFLASMYSVEFPQNVKALILVAPASALKMPSETGNLFETLTKLLPEDVKKEYAAFQDRYFDYKNIFSKTESDLISLNNEFAKYYRIAAKVKGFSMPTGGDLKESGGWMVHAMYFSMGKRHDYRDGLKNVKVPVLVIHGENDLQSELESRVYSDLYPNSKFIVIKNAGHFVFNDQPEEFANVVGKFLNELK
jgi:proline iminopeptidase